MKDQNKYQNKLSFDDIESLATSKKVWRVDGTILICVNNVFLVGLSLMQASNKPSNTAQRLTKKLGNVYVFSFQNYW